ncbi:MAG: DUF305 domain-containing protein [Micrococcus sp.]|nr:DUF305 domain-containing protein [Micrococcus sp.]
MPHSSADTPRARRSTVAVAATALSLVLALSGCVTQGNSPATTPGSASTPGATAYAEATELTPDIVFATTMIRNQEQAIEFSQLFLDKGSSNSRARQIAEMIVGERPGVVEQLGDMLDRWGVGSTEEAEASAQPVPTASAVPSEGPAAAAATEGETVVDVEADAEAQRRGLLTSNERRILEVAPADDAARIYLLQMQRLHQGARMIAATEVQEGSDAAATALAGSLRDQFDRDIRRMQSQLGDMGVVAGSRGSGSSSSGGTIDNTEPGWQQRVPASPTPTSTSTSTEEAENGDNGDAEHGGAQNGDAEASPTD